MGKLHRTGPNFGPNFYFILERCATVRIWITLLIPKIEDGNNFGVGVQEDALAELRQVEAECATYLDQISRYFLTRFVLLIKIKFYVFAFLNPAFGIDPF